MLLKVISHLTVQFRCPELVGDFPLHGGLGSRLLPSHGSAIPQVPPDALCPASKWRNKVWRILWDKPCSDTHTQLLLTFLGLEARLMTALNCKADGKM